MIELKTFWGFNEKRKQIGNKVDMITFDRKVREVSRKKKNVEYRYNSNQKEQEDVGLIKKKLENENAK